MLEEPKTTYPNIKQSWGIAGIAILLSIVCSPITILLNDVVGKELAFMIAYVLSIGVTFWIAHAFRTKRNFVNTYNFEFSSVRIMLLASVAVVSLQIGLVSPVIDLLPMPEFMKKIFAEMASHTGVISLVTVVIVAPLLEELIFRGIVLQGLLKQYSPLRSILLSSILFGIIHLNPWQFFAALVIGSFSGWLYYKTGKLTLSILIHAVNNLAAFATMYFYKEKNILDISLAELYGGPLNLILIISGAIIVAAASLYFLRLEIEQA